MGFVQRPPPSRDIPHQTMMGNELVSRPDSKEPSASAASSPTTRRWWVGLVLTALVLGISGWRWFRDRAPAEAKPAPQESTHRLKSKPGPWGELEFVPIVIETPDEYISVSRQISYELRWNFQGHSPAQVQSLFRSADLSPMTAEELQNERSWQVSQQGVVVVPTPEAVLSLTRPARERIYNVLAECGGNALHEMPMTRRLGSLDEWFTNGGLAPETVALTKRLLFQRGNAWCLADWPVIVRQLPTPADQRRLVKTVSRQSTLLGRIRLDQDTDVEKLVAYWGRGGRAKDIRAMVESMTRVQGGMNLDIVHLLPRFVRARLYTYPLPVQFTTSPAPNCFWTSLNFFANEGADDKFHDPEQVDRALAQNYAPVAGEPLLGDVLVLSKTDGRLVHAAVFIADDVVLTKNGAHHTQPWILAKLDDLIASYPSVTPLKLRTVRRLDL